MANAMQAQQHGGQPNQTQQQRYVGLLKPEQIATWSGLTDEKRKQFVAGAATFWQHIESKPPTDPLHQEAVNKLRQVTQHLHNISSGNRMQQPGSQAQPTQSQVPQSQPMQRPPSQGQLGQATGQMHVNASQQQTAAPQNRVAPQAPPPYPQLPEPIRRVAESAPYFAPPSNPDPQTFKTEARNRFAQQLYMQTAAKTRLQEISAHETKLRANNQSLSDELQKKKSAFQEQYQTATNFISKLKQQQDTFRNQQTNAQSQQAARNANGPLLNSNQPGGQNAGPQHQPGPPMQNAQQRPAPHNAPSPQQQVNRPGTAGSPAPAQAPTPAALSQQAQQQQQQQNQQAQSFQRPQPPNQAAAGPFSQQSPQNVMPSASQPANPYTQQGAAMDQRSYSNGGTNQPAGPQQFTTPSTEKSNKWPINKDFTPSRPQPVPMGAMRPTLANPGSAPGGPMGQPAIQQPPSYNLHGPSDHVLNKKKLDELVRQVCGAGDSTSAQGLHPEVEESVLELADEFFDNVVSSACRLAKLRGSATLEIKDIQLVLQRQYNIRIPGYSTDEVRTVRKIQPTASYLQKMNAIQAAKVMGGKGD